jgi:predicted deacylase
VGEVFYINSPKSGLFVPELDHCDIIQKDDKIGAIVNPIDGRTLESIYAPSDGILFTLREYPVVYEGSLLARILGGYHAKD